MAAEKKNHSNSFTWDERWMLRALDLAARGLGNVSPNPLVGAVLVCNNEWIGEGWHEKFGGPHAEIMALDGLPESKRALLPQSTLYVTLEPCSHYGKTPPCSLRLIREKVQRVVIGTLDPNPLVAGAGVRLLEDAGITVTVGVMEAEARALIRTFQQGILNKRPYVFLKWAQSKEGYIGVPHQRVKLSRDTTNRLGHQWRQAVDGILIGSGTALVDQPLLSNRHWWGKQPRKFVLDRSGRLDTGEEWLRDYGVLPASAGMDKDTLPALLHWLYTQGIGTLLVEGGASLHQSFLEAELWDELKVIQTKESLDHGVKAPSIQRVPCKVETMGEDAIFTYLRVP